METDTSTINLEKKGAVVPEIQIILSKSYTFFFASFVFGLFLDLIFKIRIKLVHIDILGLFLIMLGSLLIYWAQKVNKVDKYTKTGERNFAYGPYTFSRHPTYLGVFCLMLGAGVLFDSVIIVVVSFCALIIASKIFMEKEEKRHILKYGKLYLMYTEKVRRIL